MPPKTLTEQRVEQMMKEQAAKDAERRAAKREQRSRSPNPQDEIFANTKQVARGHFTASSQSPAGSRGIDSYIDKASRSPQASQPRSQAKTDSSTRSRGASVTFSPEPKSPTEKLESKLESENSTLSAAPRGLGSPRSFHGFAVRATFLSLMLKL